MADLTKHGIQNNIRIPPESTGNRLRYTWSYALRVSGITILEAPLPWSITTNTGIIGFVFGAGDIINTTTKRIDVILRDDSESIDFVVGQEVTIGTNGNTQVGIIEEVEKIYSQAVSIVGGSNPNNAANVDREGSLFVRFTEGAQQLDTKGLTRVSTPTAALDVKFIEGTNDIFCYGRIEGGASQSFDINERILLMDVGTSATDAVVKRSNRTAFFQGGFASLFETTVAIGDTGKDGVVRRWGYYDDSDGLFFELNGTEMNVVVRSSVTGSMVERRVPQSEWNVDRLDGSGGTGNLSGLHLDVSSMNYYFIDFPGSAAGKVRFGMYGNRGRIAVHEFYFMNTDPFNFMRAGLLPVTWEIFNTQVTASPSRMKTLGGTVLNEGFSTPDERVSIATNSTFVTPSARNATGSSLTALFSARAGKLAPNGTTNKKTTIPQKLVYHITGGPIILQILLNTIPENPNWQKPAPLTSPVELDLDGTYPTDPQNFGLPVLTRIYDAGTHIVDPPTAFNLRGQGLSLRSDGEFGPTYTFAIRPVNPSDNVTVLTAIDWVDV